MNKDDIIRMACEAGVFREIDGTESMPENSFEEFANLVAAAIDNKYPIKFTHEEYNAVIDAAVADGAKMEREACAKLMGELTCMGNAKECFEVAATYIRARGQE
jgi:hypothetical protein